MAKKPEITDATRQRINDSFWTLFKTKPIEKITVGEVAEAAGIHRSSFYRYYPDVYYIIEEFRDKIINQLKVEASKLYGDHRFIKENVETYQKNICQLLENNADKIFPLLLFREHHFREDLAKEYARLTNQVPESIQLDTEYTSNNSVSLLLFNFMFWYERRDKYTLFEVISMSYNLFEKEIVDTICVD